MKAHTLSSDAIVTKASSIFLFSLADVSKTDNNSGKYSHMASASDNSTWRFSSRSHLLPTHKNNNVYRMITGSRSFGTGFLSYNYYDKYYQGTNDY